ncbi:lytic polysaccharide monooxygenase [Roseateles amylovorans]|uniref:Lytic polysaccharide monooxygenase n=1 Tax=Roseateles amylovorans TaxID=2978473 RepID=A0ABY6B642_9BURK|nr:lytic polysaccharide monooxygenase [Roseateles amylovorans]UXH80231.1 lytic polysaccharide monooxygenase [Roseateles amylovorans]
MPALTPVLTRLSGACLLGLLGWTPASDALAHGAPEFPISRQYNCYKNPSLPACQAAIATGGEQALYDWNGVNQAAANGNHRAVVPDLKICAGGQEKFKGFDLARNDWPATAWSPGTDGKYEYRYNATAPHRSLNWTFFLTRDGWTPTASPLRWSDLEQVAQLGPDQIVTSGKTYTMKLSLPKRSGKQVLFSVWQRADSTEAFYACSDVDFGGATTPPSVPTGLKQIGQVSAAQDLPLNSQVKLRVFDKSGGDLETIALTLPAATAKAAWLSQIAARANQASAYLRIGTLQGGNVVVPSGVTVMDVYLLNAASGASYAMDVLLPATPPTTPPTTPGDSPAWVEGASYAVGQVVSYQGKRYRCLQAHTAYQGAGWTPSAAGVLDILWKAL